MGGCRSLIFFSHAFLPAAEAGRRPAADVGLEVEDEAAAAAAVAVVGREEPVGGVPGLAPGLRAAVVAVVGREGGLEGAAVAVAVVAAAA